MLTDKVFIRLTGVLICLMETRNRHPVYLAYLKSETWEVPLIEMTLQSQDNLIVPE